MQFAGFTQSDFDAYLPSRAGSNAYNRPRLEVKQRSLGLARAVAESARAAGIALDANASDEHPSLSNNRSVTAQWTVLCRDGHSRRELEQLLEQGEKLATAVTDPTPFFRHALLAIYLDAERVETAFQVHANAWIDAQNLRALLHDPPSVQALLSVINGLPEGFVLGVTAEASLPAPGVGPSALRASIEALDDPNAWWFLGRAFSRAEAIALGPLLGEKLRDSALALLPVYQLVAWSETNDRAMARHQIAEALATRSAHVSESAAREAAWRAERDAGAAERRELAIAVSRERLASLEPARPAAVHAALHTVIASQPAPTPAPRPPRPPRPKAPLARHPETTHPETTHPETTHPETTHPETTHPEPGRVEAKTHEPRASAPRVSAPRVTAPQATMPRPVIREPSRVLIEGGEVSLGARVKVRAGPFSGKVGRVTGLDARGGIKVAFGLLSARLEAEDVIRVTE